MPADQLRPASRPCWHRDAITQTTCKPQNSARKSPPPAPRTLHVDFSGGPRPPNWRTTACGLVHRVPAGGHRAVGMLLAYKTLNEG
eukprot:366367-Chlamydomonas_euryale.AAC.15